jgi:hypothetical protein
MVALAQLLGLAVVCGNILAFFEEHGAPRPVLWLAAVIFAASPVNGTMVVTLWKDIPYGIAILGLTYLLLKIVQSNGGWLEAKRSRLLLGVAVSLAALFRHNGWPVAFGSVLLLAFIFPLRWKSISAALLVGLGLYLGIRGPVYRWVGVETPSEQVVESVVRLYFLSANVTHGSQADNAFNTIRPFSTDWTCDVFVTVNEAWNRESASKVSPAFLQVSNFVRRFPQLAMYFYRCNRSLIWIVSDPAQFIRNTSHVPNYVDPNSFGITPDSQLPVLRDPISRFVMKTALDTRINWFVWRPALYLYGFLLLIAIQAIKHRRWKFLMVTAPILLQSIGSTLILMLPNFRYHYSPYLICLIMWPLLFTRSDSQEDGLLPDGTVGLQASEQEARQAAH